MSDHPHSIEEITPEYLTPIARKLLADDSAEVTSLKLVADPFEFPRFGEKRFFEIPFHYTSSSGEADLALILRVMPKMDAVMMLTGDTDHRELRAFESGLFKKVPDTFHVPYIDVICDDEREQYWAFVEDVRPEMAAVGMHAALPDHTLRTILSHLAAFHARFWEQEDVLSEPWLMSLRQPVDYFYRAIVDIMDGMKDPAEPTTFMLERWPWLSEGVINLMDALDPDTRKAIETIYREPDRLLEKIDPLPRTLLHYDFDNRNLGIRTGPDRIQTVVIDWEIVGEGVSSADVGRFLGYQQPPNMSELVMHYLDELEAHLGRPVDREQWLYGSELVTVALWQIVGVLFGVMVSAPSAPVPDDQREAMRQRVFSDIALVESLVRKHNLA